MELEPQQSYNKDPEIVAVSKYGRIAWAGNVWMSKGSVNLLGKRPLGKSKQRRSDKVKKILAEIRIYETEEQ